MTALVTVTVAALLIAAILIAASQHQTACHPTSQPVGWYTTAGGVQAVYACQEP